MKKSSRKPCKSLDMHDFSKGLPRKTGLKKKRPPGSEISPMGKNRQPVVFGLADPRLRPCLRQFACQFLAQDTQYWRTQHHSIFNIRRPSFPNILYSDCRRAQYSIFTPPSAALHFSRCALSRCGAPRRRKFNGAHSCGAHAHKAAVVAHDRCICMFEQMAAGERHDRATPPTSHEQIRSGFAGLRPRI